MNLSFLARSLRNVALFLLGSFFSCAAAEMNYFVIFLRPQSMGPEAGLLFSPWRDHISMAKKTLYKTETGSGGIPSNKIDFIKKHTACVCPHLATLSRTQPPQLPPVAGAATAGLRLPHITGTPMYVRFPKDLWGQSFSKLRHRRMRLAGLLSMRLCGRSGGSQAGPAYLYSARPPIAAGAWYNHLGGRLAVLGARLAGLNSVKRCLLGADHRSFIIAKWPRGTHGGRGARGGRHDFIRIPSLSWEQPTAKRGQEAGVAPATKLKLGLRQLVKYRIGPLSTFGLTIVFLFFRH
jgi:hypothetical protein